MKTIDNLIKIEAIPENVDCKFLIKYEFKHVLSIHSDNEVYENSEITMVIRESPIGQGYNIGAKWYTK